MQFHILAHGFTDLLRKQVFEVTICHLLIPCILLAVHIQDFIIFGFQILICLFDVISYALDLIDEESALDQFGVLLDVV